MRQNSEGKASRALATCASLAAILALTTLSAGCTPDSPDRTVAQGDGVDEGIVVRVNGEPLHQAELQLALGALLAQSPPASREDLERARQASREELVNDLLQAQIASEQGLEALPAVRGSLAYYRIKVLADAQRQAFLREHPVSEQELRAEYGEPVQEYHLQHILLGLPRDADQLLARLSAGESWDELARLYSADGTTADRQGDLGWLRLDQLPNQQMADAVRKLAVGATTPAAVQAAHGWHVLRLAEAPRPATNAPAFDQLPAESRNRLAEHIQRRKLDQALQEVRERARIEVVPAAEASPDAPPDDRQDKGGKPAAMSAVTPAVKNGRG